MEEKKLTDEEIVKALDICTTADDDMDCRDGCPMYDESYCASKLMRYACDLIHRLQNTEKANEEAWDIKEESYKRQIAEQKAEIERLTEEKEKWEKSCRLWSGANKSNHLKFTKTLEKLCEERNKNAELQKQVNELNDKLYKSKQDMMVYHSNQMKQAVKDTAKEILQKIMNIIKKSDGFLAEEVVRILAKRYGVEVENEH